MEVNSDGAFRVYNHALTQPLRRAGIGSAAPYLRRVANAEIAHKLVLTQYVKVHTRNIFGKLGVAVALTPCSGAKLRLLYPFSGDYQRTLILKYFFR